MDTTSKKALIKAGKATYNQTGTGLSKLLVLIPVPHRIELARLAKANGTSQQELIRFAIASLLEDPSQFAPAPKPAKTKPEPVQPELTLQEQLAVAVASEDYTEAARLRDLIANLGLAEASPSSIPGCEPEIIAQRLPQPGPEYTWVNRGSGGYWRRGKRPSE